LSRFLIIGEDEHVLFSVVFVDQGVLFFEEQLVISRFLDFAEDLFNFLLNLLLLILVAV